MPAKTGSKSVSKMGSKMGSENGVRNGFENGSRHGAENGIEKPVENFIIRAGSRRRTTVFPAAKGRGQKKTKNNYYIPLLRRDWGCASPCLVFVIKTGISKFRFRDFNIS